MPRKRRTWTKKRKTRENDKWYIIRSIVDERNNKGEVEYLVDWENDPKTGEVYENSWTKSAWVTDTAKAEWEARRARNAETEEPAGPNPPTADTHIEVPAQEATPAAAERTTESATRLQDDSEDSQPPRPANWRYLQRTQFANLSRDKYRAASEDSEDEPLAKRPRRCYNPSPSQEPAPSITSSASFPSATSYDLLDEATPPPLGSSRLTLTVEINQANFDVSEYHSVHDSQSSLYSSQPISELEAQDKRVALASSTSQKTIPDSQETSNPSLLGGTTPSGHSAQQRVVPDSQSRPVSRKVVDEATHNFGQPESILSSAPEEFVPDSTGHNSDIPSRQPIHQLDFHDASDPGPANEAETGRVVVPELALKSQSQQLASSNQLEFARQKTPSPTQSPRHQDRTQSDKSAIPQATEQDLPWEIARTGRDSEAQAANSEAQAANSETVEDLDQPQPVPGGNETSSENAEAEEAQASDPGLQQQRQIQLSEVELQLSAARDFATETDSQDAQPKSSVSAHQATLESSEQLAPHPIASALAGTVTSECEVQKRAPSRENRGVSQANYLTQPDFPTFQSAPSSSYRDPSQTSTSPNHHSVAGSTPRAPTKSLPKYSPGILRSLCEDSQGYGNAMLGSEGEEVPMGRPSALSGMQAIWDDEPAGMKKKEGIKEDDPPMTEPMASPSGYHTVAIAGPSSHGFFGQLSEQAASWTANESSGMGTEGVTPSGAVAGMRKLLNDDYLELPDAQPATVSPAEVSLPSEAERLTLPVLLSHDATVSSYSSAGQFLPPGEVPQLEKEESSPLETETIDSYLVTLPFPSNMRQRYYSTIMKYQAEAAAYIDHFTSENVTEPEPALSAAIGNLFAVLRNFCDYPDNALEIQNVPLDHQVKFYIDANAKLNFLYELFQAVTQDTKILIIARSPNILRMICNIAEALHIEFVCEALGHSAAKPSSHLRLTLSLSTATVDPWQHDVVISYDSISSDSEAMKALTLGSARNQQLLVLRLAIAFTIEHIEAEIPPPDIALMRKPTVLNSTANARYLVLNPPRLPKPHEIATMFSDFINKTTESLEWEPEPLPAAVLDIYASQTTTQVQREISVDSETAGRKRKPDAAAIDAETKRLRVESQIDIPPLSDSIQAVLREVGFTSEDASATPKECQLNLPLGVMEALAQKYLEAQRAAAAAEELEPRYRSQVQNLQRQVKDQEETQEITFRRLREAIADRTQFEADAQKAVATLTQANEAAQLTQDKAQKKIGELEAVIARLTQDSAVSANEKLLEEAHRKIQMLEKRLETAHSTEAYTRDLYQQVSNSVHATNSECERLRGRNAELEKVASEGMVKAQQEQSKISSKAYLAKIKELETSLREAHIELDRTREENRNYRNGRRETRQVSVPCSPRVGSLMSPRPRAAFGGQASRAASPAPAMGAFDGGPASSQFSTPSGNGRFVRR